VGPVTGSSCDAERVAAVMAALASPWRIEIVRLLAEDELDVTDIAERLGLSVANTSHHLGRLRQAGLVTSRRDGTRITNRLAGTHVRDLCVAACDSAGDSAAAVPRPD
jgi:DNA-binding transcriptional ArsR family regulator